VGGCLVCGGEGFGVEGLGGLSNDWGWRAYAEASGGGGVGGIICGVVQKEAGGGQVASFFAVQ